MQTWTNGPSTYLTEGNLEKVKIKRNNDS